MNIGIVTESPIKWYEYTPVKIGISTCLAALAGISFKSQGQALQGIRVSKSPAHLLAIICTISLVCYNIGLLFIQKNRQKISAQNKQKIEELNNDAQNLPFSDWQRKYPDHSVLKYVSPDVMTQLRQNFLILYENEQSFLSLHNNPYLKWLDIDTICAQELGELSQRLINVIDKITPTVLMHFYEANEILNIEANTQLLVEDVNPLEIESWREVQNSKVLSVDVKFKKVVSIATKIFNDFLHPIGKSIKEISTEGKMEFKIFSDAPAFAIESTESLQFVVHRGPLITTPGTLFANMIKTNKLILNLEDNQPLLFNGETLATIDSIIGTENNLKGKERFNDLLFDHVPLGYTLNIYGAVDVVISKGLVNEGIPTLAIRGVGGPLTLTLKKL